MKKYILTESQIKKVVDSIIQEQTDIQTTTSAVQCFLNQVMKANLTVDGMNGPQTRKALMNFQQTKGVQPDGIWGYNTQNTLTRAENQIWMACTRKYERA